MDFFRLGNLILQWMEDHPGLASWAQFIGAMLAVYAAFFAANSQVKQQLYIANSKREDFLRAVSEATEFVINAYAEVANAAEQGELMGAIADLGAVRNLSGNEILTKALEGPLSEWPSPLLFVHVQRFMFLTKLISSMADDPLKTDHDGWNGMLRLIMARFSFLTETKGMIDAEVAKLKVTRNRPFIMRRPLNPPAGARGGANVAKRERI